MNARKTAMLAAMFLSAAAGDSPAMTARQVYEKAAPSVVLVVVKPPRTLKQTNGSGFVISKEGWVVTNSHVVVEQGGKKSRGDIYVFFKPSRLTGDMANDLGIQREAKLVEFDPDRDLALLRVKDPPSGVVPLDLCDPSVVQPGDQALAIGHPEQGGFWSLTVGVISGLRRDLNGIQGKDVFQMDADINRGNSGGPLLDDQACVIGVNTSMARKAQDGLAITGINFALQSSVLKRWLDQTNRPIRWKDTASTNPGESPETAQAPKPTPKTGGRAAGNRVASGSAGGKRKAAPTPTVLPPVAVREKGDTASTKVNRRQKNPGAKSGDAGDLNAAQESEKGRDASRVPDRPPKVIEMDFEVPKRPYRDSDLEAYVAKLRRKMNDAIDELDRETEGRLDKE